MSDSKRLVVSVLLVAGGIAIGTGAMWFFNRAPAAPPTSTSPATAKGTVPAPGPAHAGPSGTNANGEDRAPMSILSEAIQTADRDRRLAMLRELAAQMVEKDIKLALEAGAKIPDAGDKLEFMRALFAVWAAKDPKAAADYAKANFKPGTMLAETLNAVIEKWAAKDPRAARAWIDSHTAGPLKEEGLGVLVQGWARQDPAAAAAWFASTGSTSQTILNALVSSWTDLDPRAAAAWVESLTNPGNKALGRVVLAGEWAGQNPAAAAEYFIPLLAEKGGVDLSLALINAWGASDPKAAAGWVDKLPPGATRNEAAGTLATIWAASDIQAAIEWSEKLEDNEMKAGVIDHLGTTWGAIEPEKALGWLRTLPPDESRQEAMRGAFNSWAATDPPSLGKWLDTAPAGPESDLARAGLGAVQADQSPADAVKTAMGISDPTLRADEVGKFFRHWRRADDTAAQEWLRTGWNKLAPDVQARLTKEQQRNITPR